MKTFSAKPSDVKRSWYVLDASEAPLGRLSTVAARLLIGKDKPQVTSHIDCGDYVVIINAQNLVVTGKKMTDKKYYRYSGYPSGLTTTTLKDKRQEEVVFQAIRGMLPVNKLRDGRLKRLKVYGGSEHNHEPQSPRKLSLKENA